MCACMYRHMELCLQVNFYAFYAHLYVNGNPDTQNLIYVTCCAANDIYISLVAVV